MTISTILIAAASAATTGNPVNWTLVISVIAVCLTALGSAIKIFGTRQKVNDESLRTSPYLTGMENELKIKEEKLNQLKDLITQQHIEVEKLKIESKNSSKSLEELKQDNKDLVQRLDDLLKQFMEYMEG